MIIGEKDTLLTGFLGYTSSGAKDAINNNNPESERVLPLETTITDETFLKTPRYPLYGVSQFYYNHGYFGRILTKNF